MKTEKIELSDGSFVTKHVPESKADVEKIAEMVKANPDKWDVGGRNTSAESEDGA